MSSILVKYIPQWLILTLLFSFSNSLYGQNNVTLNLLNPLQKVAPGGHFTMFFEVKGINEELTQQDILIELPEKWQVILTNKIAKNKFYTTITSPLTSKSGLYSIKINISTSKDIRIAKSIPVEITSVRKIDIYPLSNPEYVKEGDSLHLDYLIQNVGNVLEKVKISTSNGKISSKDNSFVIEPSKNIQVRVSKKVPLTEDNYWILSNDLFVLLKDSINPIANYSSVPVYATKNKKNDPYLRFPVEIGGQYSIYNTSRANNSSFQFHAHGNGFLDFQGKHQLDFTVNGPNQIGLPTIGSYDQYSLNYTFKNKLSVSIGDYMLSYNNLMEFGRFGRGVNIDYKFKKIGINTFYLNPRFYPNQRETYGAKVYLTANNHSILSLNFLSKNLNINEQWLNASFLGLSGKYRFEKLHLNTEIAVNRVDNKTDFGFFNKLYFHYKNFQFQSDLIYAGKGFQGFYRNSWQVVNSMNYYLSKKLSLNLQSNFTRVNPNFDSYIQNTSPYYSNNNIVLNYDFTPNKRLMLGYNIESNEDKSIVKQFNYQEKYGRLAFLMNSEKFQLWYENRYGWAKNELTSIDATSTRSIRAMIQPNFRIYNNFWMGSFFEYQNTAKFSVSNQTTNYFYYGINSRMTVNDKFNFTFAYRNNYAPDELVQRRNFLDLTTELNLKHHKFSLVAGHAYIPNYTLMNENTLYMMVKYSLKLNVPLSKNKKVGAIVGKITSDNNLNKSGVLLSLGDKKFLTDANGAFYFNELLPDKYLIMVDKTTLEKGTISSVKTPLEVEVEAQNTKNVFIPIVKAGNVKGKIEYSVDVTSNHGKTSPPVIYVKLFNDHEYFTTKVNDKGIFAFQEMKPGLWQIQATIYGNSNSYTINKSIQSLEIKEKENTNIIFNVNSKERKIHFSDKNFHVSN